jgi:hypothetical protein
MKRPVHWIYANTAYSGKNCNISRVFNVTTVPLENYALKGLRYDQFGSRTASIVFQLTTGKSDYGLMFSVTMIPEKPYRGDFHRPNEERLHNKTDEHQTQGT